MTIVREDSYANKTMMQAVLLAFSVRCKDTPSSSEIHPMKSSTTACLICVSDLEILTLQSFFLDR